jgi:cytoskeletal protein CcmA (bactofilin family)
VFVNGVEFATDGIQNREVESNDGIRTESDLSEGMILRVDGQWRNDGQGTADKLSYDDTLRGPIEQIDPDPTGAGEFVTVTVMGQTVRVDRRTVVRGTTFASLLGRVGIGEHLRVSAWRQADGSYRAGYIGIINANLSDIELEGTVTEVNIDLNQFTIGTITVKYDENNVAFGSGLIEADIGSATALEVEGTLAGNVLMAESIDRDDARRFGRADADDIEFTATIDAAYAAIGTGDRPGEFTVGNLTIRVTDTTELGDGLTLSDLQEDLLVQVEGRFLSETVVEAEEITLREASARVEGVISTASDNELTIGGVKVKVTSSTLIAVEDGSEITFATLPVGSFIVKVEGIEIEQGTEVFLEALRVEVDDEIGRDQFELEGRLREISSNLGSISLLGVGISDIGADYNASRGGIVDAFDRSEIVILEVEYTGTTSGFVADEIELEENDDD